MKKETIANILHPYWKEYLQEKGIEQHKKLVEDFNAELVQAQSLNLKTFISFAIQPDHLFNYISFQRSKREVLKSFWRFSTALLKIKDAHTKGTFTMDEWNKYLTEYFEGTLGSANIQSRLLITSEVLKFIE